MKTYTTWPNIGLLILRLVVGGVFLYHGMTKFDNIGGTIGFFASLGFAPFMAYGVALIETLGGLLLMLGFFPRVIGGLFTLIMLVAIFKVKGGINSKAEFEIVLMFLSLAIFFTGVGSITLPLAKRANNGPYLR